MIALEQLPRPLRPAFSALWKLDLAFADVISTSSDPRLGAIRLAWWRERLEELDTGASAPSEPRLQAVASELVSRGIGGAELSRLEDAWQPLLAPFPWGAAQVHGLKLRGAVLFGIGARLMGADPDQTEAAGEIWSLIDGAWHCSDPSSRELLLDRATDEHIAGRAPRVVRPLTILAALAISDVLNPSSGVARAIVATSHRLTGRYPLWS